MTQEYKPLPEGLISFDEFLNWCDEDTHAEWVAGRIVVLTRPPLQRVRPPADAEGVSFEEFLKHYDGMHAEWLDGSVYMMSPASNEHQNLFEFLLATLRLFNEARQVGWVRAAPFVMRTDVHPTGREPDLLFVVRERMHLIQPNHLAGPADLAVEIVSPESDGRDRGEKFVEYEAAGVREYWLLDPLRQEAIFYQRGEDGLYRPGLIDAEGIYRSAVVEGFWLRVPWLWQRPLPTVLSVLKELQVI